MKFEFEVICLQDDALKALIDKVVTYVKSEHGVQSDRWITQEEAMQYLNITSKTTLQKYRDEGNIRYSELSPRHFMYDFNSINSYLAKRAKDTF